MLLSIFIYSCQKNALTEDAAVLSTEDQEIKSNIDRLTDMARAYYHRGEKQVWSVADPSKSISIVQNTLNYWHSRTTSSEKVHRYHFKTEMESDVLSLFLKVKSSISEYYDAHDAPAIEFITLHLCDDGDSVEVSTTLSRHPDRESEGPQPLYSFPYSDGYMPYTFAQVAYNQTNYPNIEFARWDLMESIDVNGNVTNNQFLDYEGNPFAEMRNVLKELFFYNARHHYYRVQPVNDFLYATNDLYLVASNAPQLNMVMPYHMDIYGVFPTDYTSVFGFEPFCFYFAGTGQYNYATGGCQTANWSIDPQLEKKTWLSVELMDFYLKNIFYMADQFAAGQYVEALSEFLPMQSSGQCFGNINPNYNDYLGVRWWRIKVRYKYHTGIVPPPSTNPPSSTY